MAQETRKLHLYPAVPIATVVVVEDLCDASAYIQVFVSQLQPGTMVKVRASSKANKRKQFWQFILTAQRFNQHSLIFVCQAMQINASPIF